MNMDDQDWLDAQLVVDRYIPDDGFTGRVVGRLPKRGATAGALRQRILFVSAFLAMCLVAVQIVPLFRSIEFFVSRHSPMESLVRLAVWAEQPIVVACAAGGMIALAVAAIPFSGVGRDAIHPEGGTMAAAATCRNFFVLCRGPKP